MGLDKYTCFQNFLHVDNKVTPYVGEVFASFKMLPNPLSFHLRLPEDDREGPINLPAA